MLITGPDYVCKVGFLFGLDHRRSLRRTGCPWTARQVTVRGKYSAALCLAFSKARRARPQFAAGRVCCRGHEDTVGQRPRIDQAGCGPIVADRHHHRNISFLDQMFYSTANGFIGSPIGDILYRRDTEADIENAETVDIVAKAAGSLPSAGC